MKKYFVLCVSILLLAGFLFFYQSNFFKQDVKDNSVAQDAPDLNTPAAKDTENISLDSSVPVTPDKKEIAETTNEFTEEDIEIWTSWASQRGYDVNAHDDYESMNNETLTTLAEQHDAKAHSLLAKRLLDKLPYTKQSLNKLDEAAQHLYAASALGYTATLAQLSEVMQRKAQFEKKPQRDSLVLEAYKFAYLGSKRGDPNSDSQLLVLQQTYPLSETENQLALKNADKTYEDMSAFRQDLKLPPFDNGIPHKIQPILDKVKKQAEIIQEKLMQK